MTVHEETEQQIHDDENGSYIFDVYENHGFSDNESHSKNHSHGNHVSGEALVIFFLFGGLLVGGILKEINKKTGIPYTPMLFTLGILFGYFYTSLGMVGEAVFIISNIDPHGILMIFLPTLIFESGFNADWHVFKRQFTQIIILAVPCVFISALFMAFCIKVILGYNDEYYTWSSAFMFGSILSCTDTVAVISLLKEIGASKKFNSLIEGESLINDGTCMVLLQLSSELVKGRSKEPYDIAKTFVSLALGGVLLGIAFGVLSALWIRKIFSDEILVVNITFISCYLLFFVCENVDLGFKVSGIIALVSLGLFMSAFGKTRISSENEHAVHTFWKYAVYVAETIIFLLAGVVIGIKVIAASHGDPGDAIPLQLDDFIKLGELYICMMIVRYLVIGMFMPILRKSGYGLTWKEVYILTYGGLRGAIGVAFALIVARDTEYAATLRQIILFDMSGCAILTLVVNGTTTGYFVKKCGLASTSQVKKRVFLSYLQDFAKDIDKDIKEIKNQPFLNFLQNDDWTEVKKLIGYDTYDKMIKDLENELANIPKEDAFDKLMRLGIERRKREIEMAYKFDSRIL